jgi:hypothetical protein
MTAMGKYIPKPNERMWILPNGSALITSSDHAPFFIAPDGTRAELQVLEHVVCRNPKGAIT